MPELSPRILNVAFYKFTPLSGLSGLRARWLARSRELGLKGTVLLSQEGINASLAGDEGPLRGFVSELSADPAFGSPCSFETQESWSDSVPFSRILVKIKKEIIPMGRGEVRPAESTGRRLAPEELRQWLEEGRDVILLDTRNRYEIEHGSFEGARDFGLSSFREFGAALARTAPELRDRTVVMFCTGGIRCEKATALALHENFREVYQLDGGILRYFKECGGAYYRGSCFVFDERGAVAPWEERGK